MHFLGKTFIVFNFVLSILYLAASSILYVQRVDDKIALLEERNEGDEFLKFMERGSYNDPGEVEKADANPALRDYSPVIKKLSAQIQASKSQHTSAISNLKQEVTRKENSISDLELRVQEARSQKEVFQRTARDAEVDRKKLLSTIENFSQRIEDIITLRDQLSEELATVKKEHETLYLKYLNVSTKVGRFEVELKGAEKDNDRVEGENAQLAEIMKRLQKSYPSIYAEMISGRKELGGGGTIKGRVLAVNPELQFLIINRGEPHGVRSGHEYIVYRGAEYVGRIEVDEVHGESAIAKITVQRKPVQQGDEFTNKLER